VGVLLQGIEVRNVCLNKEMFITKLLACWIDFCT